MVVYSGSLQRVDFSEEGDHKGFCVVDLDPSAPQGQRLTNFLFQPVQARPFVTIDVKLDAGDTDPTDTVVRAIARKDVTGAVVRVRLTLPAELEPHLREQDLRQALAEAHYVAAISRELEGSRRTRLEAGATEGLQPLQALGLYLKSRDIEPERQEKILRYAADMVQAEEDSGGPEG